jgi:hypothetical protein
MKKKNMSTVRPTTKSTTGLSSMLSISNKGPELVSTNFWRSEQAAQGLCYLSGNAGTWRLLVPASLEYLLAEMRTAKYVMMEQSRSSPGGTDILFEDNSDSPLLIILGRGLRDRGLGSPGRSQLDVWTESGKQFSFFCMIVNAGVILTHLSA